MCCMCGPEDRTKQLIILTHSLQEEPAAWRKGPGPVGEEENLRCAEVCSWKAEGAGRRGGCPQAAAFVASPPGSQIPDAPLSERITKC